MVKEDIVYELTDSQIKQLINYIHRRESRARDRIDRLYNSLGKDLKNATVWGGRDVGYNEGLLNAYELIEDKLMSILETNLDK